MAPGGEPDLNHFIKDSCLRLIHEGCSLISYKFWLCDIQGESWRSAMRLAESGR